MRQRCGPAEGYEVARFSRPPPASRSPAPPAEARCRLLGDGLAIDHDLVSTRVHNANDWAGATHFAIPQSFISGLQL